MARLSKSEAARQLGISRTALYKLIDQGAMSATPDGRIESAELVRVAPLVDSLKERPWTSIDTLPVQPDISADEEPQPSMDTAPEQPWTPVHGREQTSTLQSLVDTLREQMQLMRDELQAARADAPPWPTHDPCAPRPATRAARRLRCGVAW